MPELPEVETTRRGILPYTENATIRKTIIRESRLRWPVSSEIATLSMTAIQRVERRAKYLLLQLNEGTIMIHLGMSGSLRVVEKDAPIGKHDHVDVVMNEGKIIRYNDPRRFGSILWTTNPWEHPLISKLGPEPLGESFNGQYLFEQSKKRKVNVKQFIMDSHVVVGVGNIYANEALFLSGIHPKRPANKISLKRFTQLANNIKIILANAIAQGGTTLKDFVGGDGKPGYFQQQLSVYGRSGQPCIKCKSTLKEIRLGQRTTVYCSNCQH